MEVREFRAGVRAWIEEVGEPLVPAIEDQSVRSAGAQLDHQLRLQRLLFDAGWMRCGWPTRLGGLGGSPMLRAVLGEELTSRALVHTTSWSMHEVLGPAVGEFGPAELVEEIFPRLLRGELGPPRHAVRRSGQDRRRRVAGHQRLSGGSGHTGRDREPAGDDGRC